MLTRSKTMTYLMALSFSHEFYLEIFFFKYDYTSLISLKQNYVTASLLWKLARVFSNTCNFTTVDTEFLLFFFAMWKILWDVVFLLHVSSISSTQVSESKIILDLEGHSLIAIWIICCIDRRGWINEISDSSSTLFYLC